VLASAAIAIGATVAIAAGAVDVPQTIVGWIGVAGTLLGAIALYRAGSVRAWKETADGRGHRIEDLERELGGLRAELAIPERIEGIIRLMNETAQRTEEAATRRMELALSTLNERWQKHDDAAEVRTQRLERGHDAIEHRLAQLVSVTVKGER
jgi:hypothetical protein